MSGPTPAPPEGKEDSRSRKNRDFSRGPVWDATLKRWLVEVIFPDQTRKRRRFRRQRDAHLWWAEQNRAIESGSWNQPAPGASEEKRSFGELCDEYRKWAKVNLRSYENYVAVGLKFWEAQFGRDTAIEKITPRWIETVKSAYAQNVEQATVDRKLEVLRAMFNWAISQAVSAAPSPMQGIKLFKPNNEIVRYLTPEEYVAILESANHERWYVRPVIELAANTGLRKRNILRLRWDECDFATGVIRITRTKSKKTVAIPMTEAARAALQQVLSKTGRYSFVFCHFDGEQAGLPIADIKKSWKAVLKAAGIRRPFRFHDLRHSCASQLLMNGASLMAVKEILGHESLKTTLRYAHLSPDYLAQEVKVLDKALPKVCHPGAPDGHKRLQTGTKRQSRNALNGRDKR
jgi:integrase